jgi:hypothetical protein
MKTQNKKKEERQYKMQEKEKKSRNANKKRMQLKKTELCPFEKDWHLVKSTSFHTRFEPRAISAKFGTVTPKKESCTPHRNIISSTKKHFYPTPAGSPPFPSPLGLFTQPWASLWFCCVQF